MDAKILLDYKDEGEEILFTHNHRDVNDELTATKQFITRQSIREQECVSRKTIKNLANPLNNISVDNTYDLTAV